MNSNQFTEIPKENEELLSTRQFVDWLSNRDRSFRCARLNVRFDEYEFRKAVCASNLVFTPSHDGIISQVKDNGRVTDLSKSSRRFVLHTDGPYYQAPPRYVILHCKNPGSSDSNISTILRDTSELLESFEDSDLALLRDLIFFYHGRNHTRIARPVVEWDSFTAKFVSNFGGKGHFEHNGDKEVDIFRWMSGASKLLECFYSTETPLYSINFSESETLVFDNQIFLHGRVNRKGVADFDRHLYRIWLDRTK